MVQMINDQGIADSSSFFVFFGETGRKKEGREERGSKILPHTGFCFFFLLFLFLFVWHLSGLLWDQMVFTSRTHSLSFSVARSQEKSHLGPIKTSLSPTKLIACVSVCVRLISGG